MKKLKRLVFATSDSEVNDFVIVSQQLRKMACKEICSSVLI